MLLIVAAAAIKGITGLRGCSSYDQRADFVRSALSSKSSGSKPSSRPSGGTMPSTEKFAKGSTPKAQAMLDKYKREDEETENDSRDRERVETKQKKNSKSGQQTSYDKPRIDVGGQSAAGSYNKHASARSNNDYEGRHLNQGADRYANQNQNPASYGVPNPVQSGGYQPGYGIPAQSPQNYPNPGNYKGPYASESAASDPFGYDSPNQPSYGDNNGAQVQPVTPPPVPQASSAPATVRTPVDIPAEIPEPTPAQAPAEAPVSEPEPEPVEEVFNDGSMSMDEVFAFVKKERESPTVRYLRFNVMTDSFDFRDEPELPYILYDGNKVLPNKPTRFPTRFLNDKVYDWTGTHVSNLNRIIPCEIDSNCRITKKGSIK